MRMRRRRRLPRPAVVHPDVRRQDWDWDGDRIGGGGGDVPHGDATAAISALPLPHNQYEVVVRRRAIAKAEDVAAALRAQVARRRGQEEEAEAEAETAGGPSDLGSVVSEITADDFSSSVGPPGVLGTAQDLPGSVARGDAGAGAGAGAGPAATPGSEHDDDLEGDTSLGLKLTILGGHVIVQGLNSLSDGRASPAQLTGMVRTGDVLVAIEGRSLVRLPLPGLVEALRPLSEADPRLAGDGRRGGPDPDPDPIPEPEPEPAPPSLPGGIPLYRRSLRLRFAIGEGLAYLDRPKPSPGTGTGTGTGGRFGQSQDAFEATAADMLGLGQFLPPMVDQLSGLPLFADAELQRAAMVGKEEEEEEEEEEVVEAARPLTDTGDGGDGKHPADASSAPGATSGEEGEQALDAASVQALQSSALASRVLGLTPRSPNRLGREIAKQIARERRGERKIAASLFFELNEEVTDLLRGSRDAGPASGEGGSLPQKPSTWEEMMKLGRMAADGAGVLLDGAVDEDFANAMEMQRKRDAIDRSSMRSSEDEKDEHSSTMGGIDADCDGDGRWGEENRSLLRLAARDEMWRNKVLHTLIEAAASLEGVDAEEMKKEPGFHSDALKENGGIESHFQKLFFGNEMSSVVNKSLGRESSQPLALPPRDITSTLFDLSTGIAVAWEGIDGLASMSHKFLQDLAFVTRFILTDALPLLLKTFRPLPWQQRKLMWPLNPSEGLGSEQGSSLTGGDMTFSMASGSTGWTAPHNQRKHLEEQIQDLELDFELKSETCHLMTFYFVRHLLPRLRVDTNSSACHWIDSSTPLSSKEEGVVGFVKAYGTYLKLHTCLISAADAHSGPVLRALLDMARFDPHHREFAKVLFKKQALVLYESEMISAILLRARALSEEGFELEQRQMLPLFVLAYPDINPWAVRGGVGVKGEGLYYKYLTLLLKAEEGNDAARLDADLVKEWCELSVSYYLTKKDDKFLQNFRSVASSAQGPIAVHRDLPMLMDLSMNLGDPALATDLAQEIIASDAHARDASVMERVVSVIQNSIQSELQTNALKDHSSMVFLGKLIIMLSRVSKTEPCHNSLSVSKQLCRLLNECAVEKEQVGHKEKALMSLIAKRAVPDDVLVVLSKWEKAEDASDVVLPALRACLLRGCADSLRLAKELKSPPPTRSPTSIWDRVAKGEFVL
jgi:hypothetical protein